MKKGKVKPPIQRAATEKARIHEAAHSLLAHLANWASAGKILTEALAILERAKRAAQTSRRRKNAAR